MAGLVPAIHVFSVPSLARRGCPAQESTLGPAGGGTRLPGMTNVWSLNFGQCRSASSGAARRTLRPSARADISVHHRNVGALFLLRHALAARAVYDQVSAAVRSFRQRHRAYGAQARAGKRLRPTRRAAFVVANLGPLYRACLFHADL